MLVPLWLLVIGLSLGTFSRKFELLSVLIFLGKSLFPHILINSNQVRMSVKEESVHI